MPRKSILFCTPPPPHPATPTQLVGDLREGGRDRSEGGCDGNYEVRAYGMEWVHDREHEQSRVTSKLSYTTTFSLPSTKGPTLFIVLVLEPGYLNTSLGRILCSSISSSLIFSSFLLYLL